MDERYDLTKSLSINNKSIFNLLEKGKIKGPRTDKKKPLKTGPWDRDETINFYTCLAIEKKIDLGGGFIKQFISTRNTHQIFNKKKTCQSMLDEIIGNFWKTHSFINFSSINKHNIGPMYSPLKDLMFKFLSENYSSQVGLDKYLFTSANENYYEKPRSNSMGEEMSLLTENETENTIPPKVLTPYKNISIEIQPQLFETFKRLSKVEDSVCLNYESFVSLITDDLR
jgi:hypothetical protein